MKKLFVLLMLAFVAIASIAQTKVPFVATNGKLEAGQYVSIFGSTADTLKNADTLTYTFLVKGIKTFDVKSQVYINHVSGNAAYKVYTYNSIDGVNWSAKTADSLTIASITADGLNATALTFSDEINVYKKIQIIQSGTAVTIPKQYFVTREN